MVIVASERINKYFEGINKEVKRSYDFAKIARLKGLDPEKEVPIPLAKNMAERVVGLISVVAPGIAGKGIPTRIIELEKEYGLLDWRVGFKIAEEVAKQKFCEFETKIEAMEVGIRVGFAYLTLGIVSAPLEGFIGLKIKKRRDGKEYFAVQYAGPIRAAGGTAASTSVILADYVRVVMGYAPWDPDEKEISRYMTEVNDYNDRVTNLQYKPSDEELKFMLEHLPIEVDGDPTERFEVSNYKDLPRIETNMIRGGVALVLAEGLTQKAPKLWKRLGKWGKEFGLEWSWMEEFLAIKKRIHASQGSKKKGDSEDDSKKVVQANNTFIMDLVAGRPILTHPLGVGGFRLRYGRTRATGFSAAALQPATMAVLQDFIAIGTQLKVERPGKACTITSCDTLDGPIVRLKDGTVKFLATEEEAKKVSREIEEILFLGDILFNYGDFSENGHALVPAGYCEEWWALEVEKALKYFSGDIGIESERLKELINNPLFEKPSWEELINLSKHLQVPLHADYTHHWKLISAKRLIEFITWCREGKVKRDEKGIVKIILPHYVDNEKHASGKKIIEELGIPHLVINKENIVIEKKEARSIALSLGFKTQKDLDEINLSFRDIETKNGLDLVNELCPFEVRDKSGTFIGARMGRPEKAKMRSMKGSPQSMFPVGEEGDRLRCFQAALSNGKVSGRFPLFFCEKCTKEMVYEHCEECGNKCIKKYHCRFCGDLDTEKCRHGDGVPFKYQEIDIKYYFEQAKKRLGEKLHPDLIKGIRGTSNKFHIVEHLSKGILRAKHDLYVNKDGTIRYDCTELPLTHFKPKEVKTSVQKLREIGYKKDIHGRELEHDDQLLEMKPQDVIVPGFGALNATGPKVLTRICNFVDELLVKFYKMEPFYNIEKPQDLVGHLIIGLAPHISAGLVGRIIGFSDTQGMITHPMYHAGLRRDCDGDEACIMLLMDSLLNFSRKYLPNRRGAATMDAPLVLTSTLNPTEVDDQVHGMDVVWKYPLEFYEAALKMKNPWEVKDKDGKKIAQLSDRLEKENQFEDFGFTHHVDNFNKAVLCSAYKTLPTMKDKMIGQMEIARTVRAVDMDDVAKLIIQKHFLKDIKGNFRKYSMQKFRCVKCNAKYRRPPLIGKCTECKGKLLFTISQGSVVKYLGPSLELCERYDFSPFLKQTVEMLKFNVDTLFGKDKDKQVGLGAFMS